MVKKKYYGIKYPFKSEDSENYFVDLNSTTKDYIRSVLMHLIFTPKGQKIRDYEFGTNLIKFIFEPNDNMTFESIKNEISNTISRYLNNVKLKNIQIMQDELNYNEIYVRIDYTVNNGFKTFEDSFVTTI